MPRSPHVKITHLGTPEHYLVVTDEARAVENLDIDALSCALCRAHAVCYLLQGNFFDGESKWNVDIVLDALWTIDGLITQARTILLGGSHE